MTQRILLVANDVVLDATAPMSGGALRAWGVAEGLRSAGFEVVLSMPQPGVTHLATQAWDRVPPASQAIAWNWQNQDEIVQRVAADVVVYSPNPVHLALRQKPEAPLVLDLHGPVMLEDYYIHGRAGEVEFDAWRKKLRWGDFFLTPGHKQKRFFWSWFQSAGVDLEDGRILQVMPVSLGPHLPQRPVRAAHDPVFVFGGGLFPWTDPGAALAAVVDQIDRQGRGQLWAFTDHHRLAAAEARFAEVSRKLLSSSRVRFPGFLPRGELLATYATADVAVDLMQWNAERELAFTTRTVEYLWCGLPVIYNDYSELSPLIQRYQAGWCIDPADPRAMAAVLDTIFAEPELVAQYGRNAQRLVREQFTWDRTIDPLARFCAAPRRRTVHSRDVEQLDLANQVSPVSEICSPEIGGASRLRARFVSQHDGLSSCELKFATHCRKNQGPVALVVRHVASGQVLGERRLDASEIEDNSWLLVELSRPVQNSGGRTFEVEVEAPRCAEGNAVSVWTSGSVPFGFEAAELGSQRLAGAACQKTYYHPECSTGLVLPEADEPPGIRCDWVETEQGARPAGLGPGDIDYFLADYNRDGTADLVAVKHTATQTERVEVHVFCGKSKFQKPLLQVATPLEVGGGKFQFAVVDWNRDGTPDLVAIKQSGTATGLVEVHVYCGRSRFQRPLLQTTTCLPSQETDHSFTVGDVDGDGEAEVLAIARQAGANEDRGLDPAVRVLKRLDGAHADAGLRGSWRGRLVARVRASRAAPALRQLKRGLGW